jgi:hypothetical protein
MGQELSCAPAQAGNTAQPRHFAQLRAAPAPAQIAAPNPSASAPVSVNPQQQPASDVGSTASNTQPGLCTFEPASTSVNESVGIEVDLQESNPAGHRRRNARHCLCSEEAFRLLRHLARQLERDMVTKKFLQKEVDSFLEEEPCGAHCQRLRHPIF